MADQSPIEWTDATWNPIAGCSVVSPGCANCYAMRRVAPRLAANPDTPHYHGTVQPSKAGPVWTGKIGVAADEAFLKPLSWRKGRSIFVNSTSDLFHEDVPDAVIDRVFAVMALTPQHAYQVLTKRAARMREYMSDEDVTERVGAVQRKLHFSAEKHGLSLSAYIDVSLDAIWPLSNVWLGVSVEDQTRADERLDYLRQTPATIRFISAEPLLGKLVIYPLDFLWIDWVICGGESGPGSRPMHPDWARSLRDQCVAAGVPFHFKQWGEWAPWDDDNWSLPDGWDDVEARDHVFAMQGVEFLRVGKARAGRLLDGREWNEEPQRAGGEGKPHG